MVLSRCCFHHLVENSIIYKKDIQPFYIGSIFFSENKIIRSVVGGKVDGHILFGARNEKPNILFGVRVRNGQIYFVPNDSYEKFYLAVKGLRPNVGELLKKMMYLKTYFTVMTVCYFVQRRALTIASTIYSRPSYLNMN